MMLTAASAMPPISGVHSRRKTVRASEARTPSGSACAGVAPLIGIVTAIAA